MRCNPGVHTPHDPGGMLVNRISRAPIRPGRQIARRRNSYGNDPRPPEDSAEKNR
jgi:hypothetical protein